MASCHLSWPYPLCFPQPPSTCSHSTPACPWHVSVTSQALSIQSPHLEYLPPLFTPIKLIFSGPSQCSLLSKKASLMSLSNASESFVCGLLFTGLFYLDMSWLMPPGIEEGISLLWYDENFFSSSWGPATCMAMLVYDTSLLELAQYLAPTISALQEQKQEDLGYLVRLCLKQ